MERKCNLILALDLENKKDFIWGIDSTKDLIKFYKVGLVAFTKLGPEAIKIVKRRKRKVFLDLKFFDIPNTMIKASLNAATLGADILDFHLSQDKESLRFTLCEIKREVNKKNLRMPLLLGVTVLTSTPMSFKIKNLVLEFYKKAKDVGFDGIILPGREAKLIKKRIGRDFKIACPGIRLKKALDDQKRVVTPKEVKGCADFIIVGRPILRAKDPQKVILNILDDLK